MAIATGDYIYNGVSWKIDSINFPSLNDSSYNTTWTYLTSTTYYPQLSNTLPDLPEQVIPIVFEYSHPVTEEPKRKRNFRMIRFEENE